MRLWVMSDLHLDVNASFPFELPDQRPEHDVVVIAGDLCEGIDHGIDWIRAKRLDERPVVYVPGNHEFYGRERRAHLDAGRAIARDNGIHMLDRDRIDLGGVTLLGATLWTDYRLDGTPETSMALAQRYLSDHRMIEDGAGSFTASVARAEHLASVAWLGSEIAAAKTAGRVVAVVTHHAPSPRSISARFQGHPLTAAFASDVEHLFDGVALWVHGHTHRFCDHRVGATRVLNNPRGYLRHEATGFDPALVVTLG